MERILGLTYREKYPEAYEKAKEIYSAMQQNITGLDTELSAKILAAEVIKTRPTEFTEFLKEHRPHGIETLPAELTLLFAGIISEKQGTKPATPNDAVSNKLLRGIAAAFRTSAPFASELAVTDEDAAIASTPKPATIPPYMSTPAATNNTNGGKSMNHLLNKNNGTGAIIQATTNNLKTNPPEASIPAKKRILAKVGVDLSNPQIPQAAPTPSIFDELTPDEDKNDTTPKATSKTPSNTTIPSQVKTTMLPPKPDASVHPGTVTTKTPAMTWERRFVASVSNAWEKFKSILPSNKTLAKVAGGAAIVGAAGVALYANSKSDTTETSTTATVSANPKPATEPAAKNAPSDNQAAPSTAKSAEAKTTNFTIETDTSANPGFKKLLSAVKDAQSIARAIENVAAKTFTNSPNRIELYKAFLEKAVQIYPQGTNGTGHYFEDHLKVLNKFLSQNPNAQILDLEKAFANSLNDRLLFGAITSKTGTPTASDKFHFDIQTDANGEINFNDQNDLKRFNELKRGKLPIAKTLEETIKSFEATPFRADNTKTNALEFIERAKQIQLSLDKQSAESKGQTYDPNKKSGAIYILDQWKRNIEAGSDAKTPIHELMLKVAPVAEKTAQLESVPTTEETVSPEKHASIQKIERVEMKADPIQTKIDAITKDELSKPVKITEHTAPDKPAKSADELIQERIAAITQEVLSGQSTPNAASEQAAEPSQNDQLAAIDAEWEEIAKAA